MICFYPLVKPHLCGTVVAMEQQTQQQQQYKAPPKAVPHAAAHQPAGSPRKGEHA